MPSGSAMRASVRRRPSVGPAGSTDRNGPVIARSTQSTNTRVVATAASATTRSCVAQ